MRRIWIAIGVVLLIGAAAAFTVRQRLDEALRRGIEERGSALTQTAVRVDSVSVSLLGGTAAVRGLSVANPPGYSAASALTIEEAMLDVQLGTILADPVFVRTIRITAPRVFYEVDAQGTANIDVIRNAIERAQETPARDPAATPEPRRRGHPKAERRFIIARFNLERGEVHVDARAVGGKDLAQTLEAFELTGIGAERGGATPEEAALTIATAMARDVALSVAAGQLERALGKKVGGPLGDAIKKGGAEVLGKDLGGMLDRMFGGGRRGRKAETDP
ncbi:MAG: hypothetical protein AB7V27_07360 [Candidatus Binatia bacterium]